MLNIRHLAFETNLSLVEALERILLAFGLAIMRLKEAGPDKLEVSEGAMVEVNLDRLEGDEEDQRNQSEDEERRSGDIDV